MTQVNGSQLGGSQLPQLMRDSVIKGYSASALARATTVTDQLIATSRNTSNPVEAGQSLAQLDAITGSRQRSDALVATNDNASTRKTDYFSKPATVANAIDLIRHSRFGHTAEGGHVVRQLERLQREGHIVIGDQGGGIRGSWNDSSRTLAVDDSMANDANSLASELVHEATHSLLSEEYARTGKATNTNSLDQEAITNGYQIQLYR